MYEPTPLPTFRELRERKGLRLRQAGTLLGISHARVSQIEKAGTQKVAMIEQLAAVYGITLSQAHKINRILRKSFVEKRLTTP